MTTTDALEQPIFELDVDPEFSEVLRATFWLTWRRRRYLWVFLILVFVAYFGELVWLSIARGRNEFAHSDPIVWVLGLYMLVAIPGLLYFKSKRFFARDRSLRYPLHYSFSEQSISVKGTSVESHVGWDVIAQVYETKTAFLLMISAAQMFFIPNSAMKSPDDISRFRQMLVDRLGDRKKVLFLRKS